jgi:hypothetical protein
MISSQTRSAFVARENQCPQRSKCGQAFPDHALVSDGDHGLLSATAVCARRWTVIVDRSGIPVGAEKWHGHWRGAPYPRHEIAAWPTMMIAPTPVSRVGRRLPDYICCLGGACRQGQVGDQKSCYGENSKWSRHSSFPSCTVAQLTETALSLQFALLGQKTKDLVGWRVDYIQRSCLPTRLPDHCWRTHYPELFRALSESKPPFSI